MRAIYSPEPARGWLPWGVLVPFLGLAFVIAPAIGASWALEPFHLLDARGDPIGFDGLLAFLLLPFAATGAVVLAWVLLVERRALATIGLGRAGAAAGFVRGLIIGMATIFGVVAAIWIAGGYDAIAYAKAFESPDALKSMGLLLLAFVVQASVEEIVFRGWMLSAIARKFNVIVAIVLTSAVFALLHYAPGQLWFVTLNVFLFAVFACAWVLRTGNIWGVMGWHAGWNWLLSIGFELPVTGIDVKLPALLVALTPHGPAHLTGGAQGPEGSMFCGIFFLAATIGLFASRDVRRVPAEV